jgi:hypothetical protein
MRRTGAAWRLGVITAVTALTGAVATPTLGQPGPVTIDVSIADVVVPAGGTSDALVVIDTNRATELADLTLVFDLSALAGVATIDPGSGFTCDTTGDLVTCTEPFPTPIDEDPLSVLSLEVIAEPGAVAGDTGTLGVEVAATGVAAAASSATVIIGVPVDLVGTGSGAGTSARRPARDSTGNGPARPASRSTSARPVCCCRSARPSRSRSCCGSTG